MLGALLRRVLLAERIAPQALRIALRAHNALYDLCGILAVRVGGGVHPKHRLLQYQEWFLDHIEPESVVLDVGSNAGAMAALVATKARHVYGVEIDQKLVDTARRINAAGNVEYLCGDATDFDYSGCHPFDCVMLSNVLEHIENRIQFLTMLRLRLPWRQPARAKFLIRVPTLERDWLSVYKKTLGVEYRLDRTHAIEHTRDEFAAELSAAGLETTNFDVRFGEFYAVCVVRAS